MSGKDMNKTVSRRNVLRTSGAGLAALTGVSTVGSAKPTFQEILDRARRIREKTGSQDQYLSYLRNSRLNVQNTKVPVKPVGSQEGDFSTQRIDAVDMNVDLTIIHEFFQCSHTNTFLEYYLSWDLGSDSSGGATDDTISMVWSTDYYNYESEEHSGNITHEDRPNTLNGSTWSFNDSSLNSGDTGSAWAGCNVEEVETSETRSISGKYIHTYDEGKVDDIRFTKKGELRVDYVNEVDTEEFDVADTNENEAESESTNC